MMRAYPAACIGAETPSGDQEVNVGVVNELAGPGVEDAQEAELGAEQPGLGGHILERLGGFAEKDVVGLRLMGAEGRAEFLGNGERDQEVGHREEPGALGIAPRGRFGFATPRAGPVVAGMKDTHLPAAGTAGEELSAQGGGAAAQNCRNRRAMGRQDPITMERGIGRPMALEHGRQIHHGEPR